MNLLKKCKSLYHKKKYKNVIRSSNVAFQAISGSSITVMGGAHIDKMSTIGSYTYIGYNCFITKADIGRYVSIANNVSIGMGEHKLDKVSTNSLFYDSAYATLTEKDCIIGNDCWIGVDCIIKRGVKIGNGAVVGANSFVNKDVPDFAIVAGSPAKIIKYRYSEEQIACVTQSRWWELEIEEAKQAILELESRLKSL